MTSESFQFLAIMVAIIGVGVSLAVLIVTLLNQQERRTNQRIDRLEDRMDRGFEQMRAEMNQGFAQLRAEMNQGFAQQDARIRNLEQGQAYMSGQFAELKDYFTHSPSTRNNPEPGD